MRAWTVLLGAGVGTVLGVGMGFVFLGDIAIGAGSGMALGVVVGAVLMATGQSSSTSESSDRPDSS